MPRLKPRNIVVITLAVIAVVCVGLAVHRMARDSALIAAVKDNDAAGVHRLLRDGADPDTRDRITDPAAYEPMSLHRVRALFHRSKAPLGPTALILAIEGGNVSIAGDLLVHHASLTLCGYVPFNDAGMPGTQLESPLEVAASDDNLPMAKELLARGADAQSGLPMYRAFYGAGPHLTKIAKLLLSCGATLGANALDPQTLVTLAVTGIDGWGPSNLVNCRKAVIYAISTGVDCSRGGGADADTIGTAARVPELFEVMLKHGMDPRPDPSDVQPPLAYATTPAAKALIRRACASYKPPHRPNQHVQ